MDATVEEYYERKHIPQLLESLVTGLTYNRPEDPVGYLESCLQEIKDRSDPVPWNTFIKDRATHGEQNRQVPLPATFFSHTNHRRGPLGPVQQERNINAVFVLGGPGSGKGTQCDRLVAEFGMAHVSVGDLLRAEVAQGTPAGQEVEALMREGKIVPLNVTLDVLQRALKTIDNPKGVLIDGFPREMQQAIEFERMIGKARFVLYFDCPESLLEQRLLKRGETSGRADDNIESIKKRFKTFVEQSKPVAEWYEKQGRLVKISSDAPIDEVYAQTRARFV